MLIFTKPRVNAKLETVSLSYIVEQDTDKRHIFEVGLVNRFKSFNVTVWKKGCAKREGKTWQTFHLEFGFLTISITPELSNKTRFLVEPLEVSPFPNFSSFQR